LILKRFIFKKCLICSTIKHYYILIKNYGKKNDLLILISSSGKSKNMINAVKQAKKKNFYKIVTFTGFNKNNTLKKKGDINFWVDSKNYNSIESAHHLYLLMIVDMVKKFI